MRLFIGIACPASAAVRVLMNELAASTRELPGIKVVPEANLHITLKFLGVTPQCRLPAVAAMLHQQIAASTCFSFCLSGAGAFSNALSNALWIGVEPARELEALAARMDDSAAALGYKKETRPYIPHLTVARMARGCRFDQQAWIERNRQRHWQDVNVTAVNLYRSAETAEGTRYTVLEHVEFNDGQRSD